MPVTGVKNKWVIWGMLRLLLGVVFSMSKRLWLIRIFLFLSFLHPGAASLRAISADPIRGLIADMTKPPKALIPAPLVPKESPAGYSYQQINCLDSIIRCVDKPKAFPSHVFFVVYYFIHLTTTLLTLCRYLDSCNIPSTVKRKCGSYTSTSDDDKEAGNKTGTFW